MTFDLLQFLEKQLSQLNAILSDGLTRQSVYNENPVHPNMQLLLIVSLFCVFFCIVGRFGFLVWLNAVS